MNHIVERSLNVKFILKYILQMCNYIQVVVDVPKKNIYIVFCVTK